MIELGTLDSYREKLISRREEMSSFHLNHKFSVHIANYELHSLSKYTAFLKVGRR